MKKIMTWLIVVVITIVSIIPICAIDIPQPSSEQPYSGYFQNVPDTADGFYLYMADNNWVSVYTNSGVVGFCFMFLESDGWTDIVYVCQNSETMNIKSNGNVRTALLSATVSGHSDLKYIVSSAQPGRITNIAENYFFESFDDGINAILDWLENPIPPSPPVTASTINYDLPPGNIAIIETDSSYSYINLKTTMPLLSTWFSSNPWPNTTQRIGYYNNLPQSINPNSMGNTIEWERSGNTTLFNITTSAKYNPSIVSTFKYIVIANPYYYPANDMEGSQYTNGTINIIMDGVVNITVKSLTATVNTQTGAVENNYNGEEWTGEIDETTNDIIWTDENGDNNAPTSGGNLSDPSISGFQSWLKGILNNIVNIFQPAHDAINTLSGAVSNFASWMYALYVWLPSPILSLLTSAISLAIVIGIIKVFI